MSSTAQPTYLSYLLRVWRDHQQTPWRASLESTATGDVRRFGDLEAMWTFLQTQLEAQGNHPVSEAPPDEST
jgi:hypothetical protein